MKELFKRVFTRGAIAAWIVVMATMLAIDVLIPPAPTTPHLIFTIVFYTAVYWIWQFVFESIYQMGRTMGQLEVYSEILDQFNKAAEETMKKLEAINKEQEEKYNVANTRFEEILADSKNDKDYHILAGNGKEEKLYKRSDFAYKYWLERQGGVAYKGEDITPEFMEKQNADK